MKTYALIANNVVWEIIPPRVSADGTEIPVAQRFTPEYVALCVDITGVDPQQQQGWEYEDDVFKYPSFGDG